MKLIFLIVTRTVSLLGLSRREWWWKDAEILMLRHALHDQEGLTDAEPQTLRYRLWHLPARLASHARQRALKISPDWPWKDAFLTCWERLRALPAPA